MGELTKAERDLAIAILKGAQRVIAEEERHRRRARREQRAAGRPLQPGEFVTTSRDDCDLALAILTGNFTAADCARAIRSIREAGRQALTAHPDSARGR